MRTICDKMVSGLVALALLATGGSAFAQGTPVAIDRVAPGQCTVAPRTVADLETVIAAAPADGTDVRVPVRFGIGDGVPVDELTMEDITGVVMEMTACMNAGDMLRLYALFSDDALRAALQPDDLSAAALQTPVALSASNRFPEPIVWDSRVQTDGRVTALVDLDGEVALVTFIWNGERYLIDLWDDQIGAEATPPAAH